MSNEELNDYEQTKADARRECGDMPLFALVERQKLLQLEKEELEAQLKLVNAVYDVLRLELVPAKMDEDNVERVTYDGIGRVSLTADMYVTVNNKTGLFEWLSDEGFGDLIQPTVNASTLKAFVKGRMKDGKDVPAEFLNIKPFTRASITKT